MSRVALLLLSVLLSAARLEAQVESCADIYGYGLGFEIAVLVLVYFEYTFGQPIPPDKGDIVLRQGYNTGDTRYMFGVIAGRYPPLGCPPFPPYTPAGTNDTILLPIALLPPGTGQVAVPLTLITHNPVGDLVLPFAAHSEEATVALDSLVWGPALPDNNPVHFWRRDATTGVFHPLAQCHQAQEHLPGRCLLCPLQPSVHLCRPPR